MSIVLTEREKKSFEISTYINKIKSLDENIEIILTNGGCYRFAKLLSEEFPGGDLMIDDTEGSVHVVYKYYDEYYDIRGPLIKEEAEKTFRDMNVKDFENYKPISWSSTRMINLHFKSVEELKFEFELEQKKELANKRKKEENINYSNILIDRETSKEIKTKIFMMATIIVLSVFYMFM